MRFKFLTPITLSDGITASTFTRHAVSELRLAEPDWHWHQSPRTLYTSRSVSLQQCRSMPADQKGDL